MISPFRCGRIGWNARFGLGSVGFPAGSDQRSKSIPVGGNWWESGWVQGLAVGHQQPRVGSGESAEVKDV
ncbi:hypothetical protein R1flu_013134 [Riccia fluitans]|uniref:Uncharacterized protein n=1 Tax=Riccia fluitans TaxID=41844 RepID=A0ABD1XDX3_9MARC